MNILIAGSSGYVGKRLAAIMLQKNFTVFGIERKKSFFKIVNKQNEKEILEGNLVDIYNGLFELKLEWLGIVNLAGNTNKSKDLEHIPGICEANITFNARLASLATMLKTKRYVYTSTYSVSVDGVSYSPQTFYAATKYASENILEFFAFEEGLDVVVLQLYDIYGPSHHKTRLIPSLIDALKNGKSIKISKGDQEFAPLFVDDACDSIIHAIQGEFAKNFNQFSVRGSETFQVRDLPRKVALACNQRWMSNQIAFTKAHRSNEIMKVAPLYEPLPRWRPKYTLDQGLILSTQKER